MLLEIVSFLKHNGMLQAKQMTDVPFSLPSIAQYAHRFASFGNLVNALHDYQSIQVGPSS